jgi:hypothetical protein
MVLCGGWALQVESHQVGQPHLLQGEHELVSQGKDDVN